MHRPVAMMVLGFALGCSPAPAPAPEPSTPPDDSIASNAEGGPDVERTCRNLLSPYMPELEEEAEQEMQQCVERMQRLHSTEPKDYAWQAECLATAKTVEAVETSRRTPRPLSPEEEHERRTWVVLAKTASHLAYYVAFHERCPTALGDLVGKSMATEPPKDAWGRPLVIRCAIDPAAQIVISHGPDGKLGTQDDYYRADDEDGRGAPK